jgi:hypothetical protein
VFTAPNFTAPDNTWYRAFQRGFIHTHGRVSSASPYSNYAKIGYDFMLFAGNALKKHGVYFQEGLKDEKKLPAYLSQGVDFKTSRDNACVPFIKFDRGSLKILSQN